MTPTVPMPGGGLSLGAPAWAVPEALPAGPDAPGARGAGPLAPKAAGAGATVLRDAMLDHDRGLGIGTAGGTTLSNAVVAAVHASSVPSESAAVLVARIGGDGTLLSVGVQRFESGDAAAWKGVAQAVAALLGKRRLGLAGLGPKGAVVHIDVRSAMTYPSGSKDAVKVRKPSLGMLSEGPARDVMPAPSPDGDSCAPERWSDLKPVCGVGLKLGSFDLADAGSRKRRSVRASFRVTLLDTAVAAAPQAASAAPAPAGSAAPPAASAASATPAADAGAP